MVAELVAAAFAILALGAELIHARRVRRLAPLAFGPREKPRRWVYAAPLARVAALAALAWGLTTLCFLPPKQHNIGAVAEKDQRHLMIVLDVSPSMRLDDAGPTMKQTRLQRTRDLMHSFFERVVMDYFRTSVVAVYSGAKPVVVDTHDLDVVDNIFDDLPLYHAFEAGETQLFEGITEAAEIAKSWRPWSTTLILISDGNTVPAIGMPKLPASIDRVLVVGVGDPRVGKFINGKQSRQDVSTLRQIAARLRGVYHNGNEKQLSSDTLRAVAGLGEQGPFEKLTRREYALLACALGALVYALLPLALHYGGTAWRPGVPPAKPIDRRDAEYRARRGVPREDALVGANH